MSYICYETNLMCQNLFKQALWNPIEKYKAYKKLIEDIK